MQIINYKSHFDFFGAMRIRILSEPYLCKSFHRPNRHRIVVDLNSMLFEVNKSHAFDGVHKCTEQAVPE